MVVPSSKARTLSLHWQVARVLAQAISLIRSYEGVGILGTLTARIGRRGVEPRSKNVMCPNNYLALT